MQTESEINEDQTYKSLGTDISCNLSSTNVANMMESPNFGKSIITQFRALDYVASTTSIESVPTIKHGNDLYHSVGLGALNLHGYLAKSKIMYGSPESIEFTGMYFQLLNYWTLYASNLIAKETGFIFHEFDKSKYANGEYFSEYGEHIRYKDDLSDTVRKLFENIEIPTQEDWCDLQLNIENHGLGNSYRICVAPTGSIAYVQEGTASIHPVVQKIEKRSEKNRGDVFYPAPYMDEGALPYYVSAYDIDQRKIIDLYSEAQKHVDQGLSLTLFMGQDKGEELYEWKTGTTYNNERTSRDINNLRNYAWTKDIKSIYYVRTFSRDGQESSNVNECESCSI